VGFQLLNGEGEDHGKRHEDGDADEDDIHFVIRSRRREHVAQALARSEGHLVSDLASVIKSEVSQMTQPRAGCGDRRESHRS